MIQSQRAFEIGYTPSFEVIDHSELFLDCVPGTRGCSELLAKHAEKFTPDQMEESRRMVELYRQVEQLVTQAGSNLNYQSGGTDYTVRWRPRSKQAGLFSILTSLEAASVSLMIRGEHREEREATNDVNQLVLDFINAIRPFVPIEAGVEVMEKLGLIKMTRRPLLVSVFRPPYAPTEDSVVRTIQLQMAHAFFGVEG